MKNKSNSSVGFILACMFLIICSTTILCAQTVGEEFVLPNYGCPMAHCNPAMSDNLNVYPPIPQGNEIVDIIWHHQLPYGSKAGLGCSGNDDIVACTYANEDGFDNLIVYDSQGQVKWTSSYLLDKRAATSAPIVSTTGDVIVCDSKSIYRFDSDGSVLWSELFPQIVVPTSPIITEGGIIIIATKGGPIFAYDIKDGHYISELYVKKGPDDPGYFETRNTPTTNGNRIYVSTNHTINDTEGRLVAIDIDALNPDSEQRLKIVWYYNFGGPSGASPLLVKSNRDRSIIYFDGNTGTTENPEPTIFGILDRGDNYRQLFTKPVKYAIRSSFAQDPRGGFWYFVQFRKRLKRLGPLGVELQSIDVDTLVNENGFHTPTSVMGIAGTPTKPVMIISSTSSPGTTPDTNGSAYVIAIDLVNESLVWKALIENNYKYTTYGQFHIFDDINGRPCVVFSNKIDGTRCVGIR